MKPRLNSNSSLRSGFTAFFPHTLLLELYILEWCAGYIAGCERRYTCIVYRAQFRSSNVLMQGAGAQREPTVGCSSGSDNLSELIWLVGYGYNTVQCEIRVVCRVVHTTRTVHTFKKYQQFGIWIVIYSVWQLIDDRKPSDTWYWYMILVPVLIVYVT